MRPLARWTIGPVENLGFEILKESIFSFKVIYPEFDLILCHNHISVEKVADLGIDLYEQLAVDMPFIARQPDNNSEEASGCGWKLSPPRLRMDAHELWIDNDLVIKKRLPIIDKWLESNTTLISAGVGRCRMYGDFDRFVPKGLHVCAGLFGVPPFFDFQKRIEDISVHATKPIGGYDEQGMTAAIVTNEIGFMKIPLSQLWISEDHVEFPSNIPSAIHFVGANRKSWHRGWKSYKNKKYKWF